MALRCKVICNGVHSRGGRAVAKIWIPQAARLPLQLRAINYNDFALVWPVGSISHKLGAHRILANIIPFLAVTFVGSQMLVKKIRAAKDAAALKRNTHRPLQTTDPR